VVLIQKVVADTKPPTIQPKSPHLFHPTYTKFKKSKPMSSDFSKFTENDTLDPNLSPASLALIAAQRPDLHKHVLKNPNCYSDLADWIINQNPDQVGEYREIITSAQTKHEPIELSPTTQKIAQGAEQSIRTITKFTKNTVTRINKGTRELSPTQLWLLMGIGISAVMSLLALTMPAYKIDFRFFGMRGNIGFFSDDLPSENDINLLAVLILISMPAIITLIIIFLITQKTRIAKSAFITALCAASISFIVCVGIIIIARDAGQGAIGIGFGLGLITSLTLAIIPTSIVALVLGRKKKNIEKILPQQ